MRLIPSLTAALAAALVIPLSGCGGGSADDSRPLVGTWRNTGLRSGDTTVTCPGQIVVEGEVVDSCGADDTARFGGDGSFLALGTQEGTPLRLRGTWSQAGSTPTFSVQDFALDTDGDGAFGDDETETFSPPEVIRSRVTFPSPDTMTAEPLEAEGPVVVRTFARDPSETRH